MVRRYLPLAAAALLVPTASFAESFDYWYGKAIKAQTPDAKIASYLKAIASWKRSDGAARKAAAYDNCGYAQLEKKDYAKAADSFSKSIRIKKTADNWAGLAMDLWGMGKKEKALTAFHKAVELEPMFSKGAKTVTTYTRFTYTKVQAQYLDALAKAAKSPPATPKIDAAPPTR
jgi:tetratricopeptide (TPR) repeat protein